MTSLDEVQLQLPFTPASVAVARSRLQVWMQARGDDAERVEDARVVVSELVGNAVRHATPLSDGTLVVQWSPSADGVRLAVTDGGSDTAPHSVRALPSALNGRGLTIVDVLTRRWWTESDVSGTTVHAVLPL